MFQTVLAMLVMSVIGWCVWVRRHSWRFRWDGILTMSVALQGAGFLLCTPTQSLTISRFLFSIVGTAHVRDFVGHGCFMSAASCVAAAAGYRLVDDEHFHRLLRRIEYPSAIAAVLMLVCLLQSRALKTPGTGDFLAVPCDGWLTTYWLTYSAICIYILGYMARLLLVLRRDPRNRVTANLFIAAIAVGHIAIAAVAVHAFGGTVPVTWIWVPLATASALAATASTWSWRGRIHTILHAQACSD